MRVCMYMCGRGCFACVEIKMQVQLSNEKLYISNRGSDEKFLLRYND